MSSILKADDKTLESYLNFSSGVFNIPYTQRPYEWTKAQVERLFEDIVSVYDGEKEQHILNFITLYADNGYTNIYDGQQRTVTLLIIVAAIANKAKQLGDKKFGDKTIETYIQQSDLFSDDVVVKITFGQDITNKYFKEVLVNNTAKEEDFETTDNIKYLISNSKYISELIDSFLEDKSEKVEALRGLLKAMLFNVYIIRLDTESEEIANQMFETLNNTGKKLADFYVLKNSCVQIVGEVETAKYWDVIESNTDLLSKSTFLAQFVTIYEGKTSSNNVHKTLQRNKYLEDKESIYKLLTDLEKVSRYFLELHEPDKRKYGSETKRDFDCYKSFVNTLKMFDASQYRPVIMAMNLKKKSLVDINKVLNAIITLQLRNIFIPKGKANDLELFYANLSKQIYQEDLSTEVIINTLQNKNDSDDETKRRFTFRSIDGSRDIKIARYILRNMYDFINSNEMLINENSTEVNLEHILPQSPPKTSEWITLFPEDERKRYTQNFGNLTLILGETNSKIQNGDFKDKKVDYANSAIPQNKEIANNSTWSTKQINKRAEELSNVFINVWK